MKDPALVKDRALVTAQTSTSAPGGGGSAAPPRPTPGRRGWFGALLLRLHFYAGVLIGPFILVAALSGALYAIAPQIEQAMYPHELHAPVTSTTLPLADQIVVAEEHVGGDASPVAVRPAPSAGDTTRVQFDDSSLGESESRAIFIDPGTGEIRGDMTV